LVTWDSSAKVAGLIGTVQTRTQAQPAPYPTNAYALEVIQAPPATIPFYPNVLPEQRFSMGQLVSTNSHRL